MSLITDKLERAVKRKYFRTIDLFAGCGGMSLGFDRAGFRSVAAIEVNEKARASHELNFKDKVPSGKYRSFDDVKTVDPGSAVSHLGFFKEDAVDVIIGGPPCQAYSRLGRARLWELSGVKNGHKNDERGTMYQYYLEYVEQLKPLAFVMENVREIGKYVGQNVAEEIALSAEELGYEVRYTLLNAVWYGVPQLRERAFIIGIHKDLKQIPSFPKIKYKYDLPVGYSTARAGKNRIEFLPPHDHYVDHYSLASRLKPAISVEKAFKDLPPIFEHLDGRKGKGVPRNPAITSKYLDYDNEFTEEMKNWPGFEGHPETFTGHVIRFTPRDYEIFRRMPHGGMYPEALEVAHQIFAEKLQEKEKEINKKITEGSKEWEEIKKKTVPPYPGDKYPNKFRKMWPDHPSRTLPAHIGKDSYSHIHFDSEQARAISLREAARIQSFPDGFRFSGSMNAILKQIGNAVPPLLAFAVASELKKALVGSQIKETNHEYIQ